MHGWVVNVGALKRKIVPNKYGELGNRVINRGV